MQEVTTINELSIMIKNHIENENQRHNIFDEKLDKIQTQVTKTNGRVTKLESWRWFIMGGVTLLGIIFTVVTVVINFLK